MSINLKELKAYFSEVFDSYVIDISIIDNEFFKLSIDSLESKKINHFDVSLVVTNFGSYELRFCFGILEKNLENYELLNQFNDRTSFKGYIESFDLMTHFHVNLFEVGLVDSEEVIKLFNFHFEQILDSDQMDKYLLPLTSKTIKAD